MTTPIRGTSGFTEQFAARGPRDRRGRSLRELDLGARLFKYPCSYLIYSDSFAALPDAARKCVYQRLARILSGEDKSKEFSHLSRADRKTISQILSQTLKDLPPSWNTLSLAR